MTLFAAVAIGGATRHSGFLAPVAAIPGAFLVTVLVSSRPGNVLDSGQNLALAGLLAATVVIAHGLARLSDRKGDPAGDATAMGAPAVAGAPGGPASAGWAVAPGVHGGPPPAAPAWSEPSPRPPS